MGLIMFSFRYILIRGEEEFFNFTLIDLKF